MLEEVPEPRTVIKVVFAQELSHAAGRRTTDGLGEPISLAGESATTLSLPIGTAP